jgi:hypothetical protein
MHVWISHHPNRLQNLLAHPEQKRIQSAFLSVLCGRSSRPVRLKALALSNRHTASPIFHPTRNRPVRAFHYRSHPERKGEIQSVFLSVLCGRSSRPLRLKALTLSNRHTASPIFHPTRNRPVRAFHYRSHPERKSETQSAFLSVLCGRSSRPLRLKALALSNLRKPPARDLSAPLFRLSEAFLLSRASATHRFSGKRITLLSCTQRGITARFRGKP